MIRGRGYKKNFEDPNGYADDVDYISEKHRSLRDISNQLKIFHQRYPSDFKKCPIVKDGLYSDLVHTYKSIRSTLEERYFDSIDANYCCYCGRAEPDQLDHFQPSSLVPQFSIARFNLVRVCGPCNRSKSNSLPISVLKLKHPYLDDIYKQHSILFELSFVSVIKNREGDACFEIRVEPKAVLSPALKSDIQVGLTEMNIGRKVRLNVSNELTRNCRVRKNFPWNTIDYTRKFQDMANDALEMGKFTEFFAYSILQELHVVQSINNVMTR